MSQALVEHFFRHEYARLVATLAHRVGVQHLEAVEDAVQGALLVALDSWRSGPPDNPSAWLTRVAWRQLLDTLRTQSGRQRILGERAPPPPGLDPAQPTFSDEVADDLLRMLFACCDPALPAASQLVLALKTLCGFDVREIAARLFTSEANVYKRLGRARARLRETPDLLEALDRPQLDARLPAVHDVVYLLFTEGYLSSHAEQALRRELCDEALRLGELLADHPVGQAPETAALLALMHLHAARLTGRQDGSGGLLLLEEQDRSLWDPGQIERGLAWLARSATGDTFSRFHAEAGIAAQHALAPSFAATDWQQVAELYELLERVTDSPVHRLHRAVAVAEWRGPEAGLELLRGLQPHGWLAGSYMWSAVLADLHRRAGHAGADAHHRDALAAAPTPAIRALLERRLGP